jgi:hypothetical protein
MVEKVFVIMSSFLANIVVMYKILICYESSGGQPGSFVLQMPDEREGWRETFRLRFAAGGRGPVPGAP